MHELSPTPRDRLDAWLRRIGAGPSELVRQGNRRRVSVRDRAGALWLRLPLTLAVVLVVVAVASWPLLVMVLAIVTLASGFQLSIDRHVDGGRSRPGPDAPTSAA